MRSITPSHYRQRPSIIKNTNEQQQQLVTPLAIITKNSNNTKTQHVAASNTKSTTPKQSKNNNFLALNIKKRMEGNEPLRKHKARGISTSVKSRVEELSNIVQLSNVAPPNLRTDQRPSSTARGRSTTRASTVVEVQKPDPIPKSCRPSRSSSPNVSNGGGWNQLDRNKNLKSQKERFTLAGGTNNENRGHFMGSKMVEKVVNARKHGVNQVERNKSKAT
ncbi:hypothetical protein TanjilG_06702 [Lupinus angustifolius]|uniref:Uncharacterized protein n=2 Tax=Lupinus angustifolius TaxID=3871 RepID=A0A1J7H5K3_LUPAN|nr:hypothetical protein TanjilG_06702 [Lupinus angustifolius]